MISEDAAYAPMGQGKWTDHELLDNEAAWEASTIGKEVSDLKKSVALTKIPSFEVWCAATCYTPGETGGGKEYKALKYWTSVSVSKRGEKGPPNEFYATGEYVDKEKTVTMREKAVFMNVESGARVGDKLYTHGKQGHMASGTYLPFRKGKLSTDAGRGVPGHEAGSVTASEAGSLLQWFEATGIDFGASASVTAGADEQRSQNSGKTKVLTLSLRIQAFYGLYDYHRCEAPALNWQRTVKVEGKEFVVRMRYPNPNYTRKGAFLELPPAFFKQATDAQKVPLMDSVEPLTSWDLLAKVITKRYTKDAEGKKITPPDVKDYLQTLIGNWAGERITRDQAHGKGKTIEWLNAHYYSIMDGGKMARTNALKRFFNEAFPGRVHNLTASETTKKLNFGWSVPVAVHLWPHSDIGTLSGVQQQTAHVPLYQPWPTWESKEGRDKFSTAAYDGRKMPFVRYLQRAPTTGDRWRFALGFDKYDTVSDNSDLYEERKNPRAYNEKRSSSELVTFQETEDDEGAGDLGQPTEGRQRNRRQREAMPAEIDASGEDADNVVENEDEPGRAVSFAEEGLTDLPEPGSTSKDELVKKAHVSQTALPAGTLKRVKDTTKNQHFKTYDAGPWPASVVYEANRFQFTLKEMTVDGVQKYEDKYGSVSNLLLNSTKPTEVVGTQLKYGEVREINGTPILDMKITAFRDLTGDDEELFMVQMCKILAIYFDYSGEVAGVGSSCKYMPELKREAMEKGLTVRAEEGAQSTPCPIVGDGAHTLPPVFARKPTQKLRELITGERDKNARTTLRSDVASQLHWYDDSGNLKENLRGALKRMPASTMTVLHWLCSPWHYEYLAYREEHSVFRAGETYSRGCNRCARPFYEYQELYSAYERSHKGTLHYPFVYWRTNTDMTQAPLPFHEKKFWSEQEATAEQRGASAATLDEQPYARDENDGATAGRGFHNWPVHNFLLATEPLLKLEKAKRAWIQKDRPPALVYRKYFNHMYTEKHQRMLPMQGAMKSTKAKVQFGMKDYKLMRSVKYGNVCRDCMGTLDTAPKLYKRTGAFVPFKEDTESGIIHAEHQLHQRQLSEYSWWLHKTRGMEVDPWLLYWQSDAHERAALNVDENREPPTLAAVEGLLKRLSQIVVASTDCKMGPPVNGKLLTKHKRPPDVYVQKAWTKVSTEWKDLETAGLVAAREYMKGLVGMVDAGVPSGPPTELSDVAKRAVSDSLHEMLFMYDHLTTYRREKEVVKFDTNAQRIEYRNAAVEVEGEMRYDSLVVESFDRPGQSTLDYYFKGDGQWSGDEYVRKATPGKAMEDVGDAQAIGTQFAPDNGGVCVRQTRELRYTNLFITYSLHRRVTDANEAHSVCRKIADALRYVFGNDKELCKLLLIGYRLQDAANNLPGDVVSKKHYTPITSAKKETTTFYGDSEKTSYLYDTYETHVSCVSVDAGVEIGPKLHHPHFHLLLKIEHYTYVQIDKFRMKAVLEQLFKGIHVEKGEEFMLLDHKGLPFYTDNENAYVDIRLYPTDNWAEVVSAYMRKGADRESIMALKARPTLRAA